MDNLVATCGALWSLCSPSWRVQEMKVVTVTMMIHLLLIDNDNADC